MNILKQAGIVVVVAALFLGCSDSPTGTETPEMSGYMDISPDSVNTMLTMFTEIFDVSPHFQEGHLPYSSDAGGVTGLTALAATLDTGGVYLVYCHADGPSIAGAQALANAGLPHVYRLKGNFAAWDAKFYVDISPAEAKRKLDAGDFAGIYDVSPHFDEEHLPMAENAYNSITAIIAGKDMSKQYLVYCHADGPSMAGAQTMEESGFKSTFRLEGNFGAWKSAGYPIE